MVGSSYVTLGIAIVYLLMVLAVGHFAGRATTNSREDYLMASRSFGTVVLFFALFATNMTAVVMIGAPGLAYNGGASAYGFFVGLPMFLMPVFIMTIGNRFWVAGKKWGHITPGQIVNHRWNAKYLGLVLTAIYIVWMVAFIFVSVQGGALALNALTDGLIPYWIGALLVLGVVTVYVYQGGMRGTGWTNTFQGIVFMALLFAIFIWIPLKLGGFVDATAAVADINNGLFLNRAGVPSFELKNYFSHAVFLTLGTFMFPHMILRYMTARSPKNLKQTAVLYPLAIIMTWVPAVLIGFWGIAHLPGLENTNYILPTMVSETLPTWMIGFTLAGIFAAVMSSIDGQVLTLTTLFSEDVVNEFFEVDESREIWLTRALLVVIYIASMIGALFFRQPIISTATLFIAGFSITFFPIVIGLYWRRSTKESVYVGLLFGFIAYGLFELGALPGSLTFGFHPVIPVLVSQVVIIVVTAFLTEPPSEERIAEYEKAFQDTW